MNVLVTGWTGFLGGAVVRELRLRRQVRVLGVARTVLGGPQVPVADPLVRHGLDGTPGAPSFHHPDGGRWGLEPHVADLTAPGVATAVLDELRPAAVVHLAALANIAACGSDRTLARRVNAELPEVVASWCAGNGSRLVHVSTDQVFDGTRAGWCETDAPAPLHAYGESKLAGEQAVAAACPGAAIVRAALITGREVLGGRSSTGALLSALAVGDEVRLFTDEIRTPVAVGDVARALVDLVERPEVSGLLHCGGPRALSRFELGLAEAQAAELDPRSIVPTTRAEAGLAAQRPADLSLDSRRLVALLGWTPRTLV
jgi:dTDP-4-dehydrorhamnose reductase